MKEHLNTLKNTEVLKKIKDSALSLVEIMFNINVNPNQPLSPAIIANLGTSVTETFYIYKHQLLNEKLLTFFGTGSVTEEDLKSFLESLEEEKDDFVKRLCTIIDREDEIEKLAIEGNLFTATVHKKMDVELFKECVHALHRVYLPVLKSIVNDEFKKTEQDYIINARQLANLNIMWEELTVETGFDRSPPSYKYQYTVIGKLILKYGLKMEIDW